jgi:hypothetical protein
MHSNVASMTMLSLAVMFQRCLSEVRTFCFDLDFLFAQLVEQITMSIAERQENLEGTRMKLSVAGRIFPLIILHSHLFYCNK